MQLTLLSIVAVLLLVWLFLRRRSRLAEEDATADARPKQDTTYHAVSIRLPANACAAARELSGRRFLANAAPRLPLPECDAANCECHFSHHKDRRTGKDRRSPFGASGLAGSATSGRYKQERRERRDRRKEADDIDFY